MAIKIDDKTIGKSYGIDDGLTRSCSSKEHIVYYQCPRLDTKKEFSWNGRILLDIANELEGTGSSENPCLISDLITEKWKSPDGRKLVYTKR